MDALQHTPASREQHLYGSPVYQSARAEAARRSDGWCQICGAAKGCTAHHWQWPRDKIVSCHEVTADHLTSCCSMCHAVTEALRAARGACLSPKIVVKAVCAAVFGLIREARRS